MSILNTLRREWRAYASPRFWILGILLVFLGALAALQFRWIDQVAQSERERAKRNLSKAVSDFERDFDVEITRVVAAFEFPALNASEYAERYQEWRHLSPYPDVIHGVYVLDTRKPSLALQEVVPGEPPINSTDWEQDLQKLALPLHANAASPPPPASGTGLHVVTPGGLQRITTCLSSTRCVLLPSAFSISRRRPRPKKSSSTPMVLRASSSCAWIVWSCSSGNRRGSGEY